MRRKSRNEIVHLYEKPSSILFNLSNILVDRLMTKVLFLSHRLNATYMQWWQWWKSVCNLSQPMKNEIKHSAYSRPQYTILSRKSNQRQVKCSCYHDSYRLSLMSFFSFSFFKQIIIQSWKIETHSKRKKPTRYIIYLTCEPTRYTSRQLSSMSNRIIPSLVTLPVEIIYRILDHQTDFTIICSMRNVCQRLNRIVDSYHRYQVNFFLILNASFSFTSII